MIARSYAVAPFLLVWGSLYAVMFIGTVSRPLDLGFYGAQPASHALSWFALPMALMILTWYWTFTADSADLVRAVARVTVGCMSANTVISYLQLASRHVLVSSLLPRFWDSAGSARSVASLAGGKWQVYWHLRPARRGRDRLRAGGILPYLPEPPPGCWFPAARYGTGNPADHRRRAHPLEGFPAWRPATGRPDCPEVPRCPGKSGPVCIVRMCRVLAPCGRRIAAVLAGGHPRAFAARPSGIVAHCNL